MVRFALTGLLLAGCFSPSPQAGVPCSASGECPEGLVCSEATNTCERTQTAPDALVGTDGAIIDMAQPIDASIDAPFQPFIARYFFDDDLLDDEGPHHGAVMGTAVDYVNGRAGETEHAARIPTALTSHIRIPDAPEFDIPKGLIELWFRFDNSVPDGDLGLFSRDANGSGTNGHINLRIGHDRRLALRIQRQSDPTIEAYRCTAAAIALNNWHHVVITFGGTLTMEVDGVVANGTSWTDSGGVARDCTAAWTTGIDGNNNPWVVGALSIQAAEGTGSPVSAIAGGVQFDELVIRNLP